MSEDQPASGLDFRSIVEGTIDAIAVVAKDGTILYANRSAHELGRFPPGSLIGKSFTHVLPPEEAKRLAGIRAARHAGQPAPSRYEIQGQRSDGLRIPLEVAVASAVWGERPVDIITFRDVSGRRSIEDEMRRRQEVLQAIAMAADLLLRATDWDKRIVRILEVIARAVRVDRAYFWEVEEREDGEFCPRRHLAWVDQSLGPRSPEPSYNGLPLRASGYGPWMERLAKGEVLTDPLRAYPEKVRGTFESLGIRSLVTVPILVDSRWWGVLGFSECIREREWQPFEVDALRVLAGILGNIIKRSEAEQALRLSEERFRTLVEQASEGIVMTDVQGHYIEANDRACEILGRRRNELLAGRVGDFSVPGSQPQALAAFSAVERGEIVRSEIVVRRKDGSTAVVETSSRRLPDGRHEAILRDISDRRRAEEEIRRRDAILEAIAFAAARVPGSPRWESDMTAVLERLGRALQVDRVFYYDNETDADGRRWTTKRHGWVSPEATHHSGMESGEPVSLDAFGVATWGRKLAGGEIMCDPVEAYPEPVREYLDRFGIRDLLVIPITFKGTWSGSLALVNAVAGEGRSRSEIDALRAAADLIGSLARRRKVVEALRESEEKYRNLVEGSGQSIAMIDREGIFHFANMTASAALGLGGDEIVGRSMWDIFPKEHADRQADSIRKVLDTCEAAVYERPTVVQGEDRWFETRIQPLLKDDGNADLALVIASDVTARKEAQDQVLQYQDRLRALSSELAMTEQRERRRIAADLHDRIGQALALSKMRLGALRGTRNIREREAIVDEVRGLLDQTIQDTRSLIFDLSPPILHELGLESALEWLIERLEKEHGVHGSFSDDGSEKRLDPDTRGLIFQSARELVVNIVKHAGAKHVSLSIRRDGGLLVVTIEDDGIGFQPALEGPGGEPAEGFGLFSIRERVFPIGGTLLIDSRPGTGTRAVLSVPVNTESTSADRR